MPAAIPPQPAPLARPVTTLFGVGPERGGRLAKLGIHTVEDLLLHAPRRHEDRRNMVKIGELQLHQPAITHGQIVALGTKWFRRHTKSIFELIVADDTGRLHCRWWNCPYLENHFTVGAEVLVFGKPLGLKPRTIDHPETELLEGADESLIHLNRITPIYPLTDGLSQRWIRALIWHTLNAHRGSIAEPWPAEVRTKPALPSRAQAVQQIHFPETLEQLAAARERLALDEFVDLQRQLRKRRKSFEANAQGRPCRGDNRLIKPFLHQLGFKLTESQAEVLREIRADMSGQHPMRRLLQGDVGSGKTLVAACSALMALESGTEVALMAPTEILAQQHFALCSAWFEPLGIHVALWTGRYKSSDSIGQQSGSARPAGKRQQLRFTVGTHALVTSGFKPEDLGMVIIDEQHKFGVSQREQLLRKGRYPHLLVMTATPIPRTLGLTVYGDLDVSVLRGLPPGRGRVKTFLRAKSQLPKVWEFVLSRLAAGQQVYVVYPHIEESGQAEIKAVSTGWGELRRVLSPFEVGMVHGRMNLPERERVMTGFRKGQVKVLLATSMIEVGVDVANATVMIIENAERFGLAQLHQLRGRIGRGSTDSFCILITETKAEETRRRLRVLEETNDGFRISETDLQLRGPGELLGQEQSGLPRFRFGNLATDLELITQARRIATGIEDPGSAEFLSPAGSAAREGCLTPTAGTA